MNDRPTPETDELIRTQLARVGITPTALAAKLTLKCEDLERERDEALKKLKAPAWIPVSQSLPDDDATVLVHMADGEIWTGFLDAGAWRFVSGDRIDCPVLHWRPFPDAPKL